MSKRQFRLINSISHLDALIETVQLLGCSYEEAATRIKHQKIRQADQMAMHQYYGLSIPHKIR